MSDTRSKPEADTQQVIAGLPKRLTRHQAEPLCAYTCTDCFGDCECNVAVQDVWTRLRERLLGGYIRYSDLEERMKQADNDATRFAIEASDLRAQSRDDEALLRQALKWLEEIHPGNMTPMAEEAWDKAIAALRKRLGESNE